MNGFPAGWPTGGRCWPGAATLVTAVLVAATACAGTNGAGDPDPVRELERGAHCSTPPADAGAVRIDSDGEDSAGVDTWRVRLSMGQRSTGGYAVRVADPVPVSVTDGIAIVRVEWTTPAADAAVTQVLTRPCVEVAVPSDYAGVRFIDEAGTLRGEAMRDS